MVQRPCVFDPRPYANPLISERAIDDPRPLKVIYIGAGVSGITAAILFPKYVKGIELAIYEKNPDVGGTWWENRYPGCACDIPAHSYQLSFESNIGWSQFYATAPEILNYWKRVADKYNVKQFMKFRHRCTRATWNQQTSKWHVVFDQIDQDGNTVDTVEDIGDVFMTGAGGLNEWRWPDIPGLESFQGKLMHSANYDTSYDVTGKNIAVIGAGSSGIQIVPSLQPKVARIDHYVRGRTWIAASFGHELVEARNGGQDGNFSYTSSEIAQWRKDPASYVAYRKALEVGMQSGYAVTLRGTPEHTAAWQLFDKGMRDRLKKKPEVIDHMLPDFPPLCKRLTPGPGYLEALCADHVDVIPEAIDHVDATGITTKDGKHRAVDAIITATGFDTSYRGRFPVLGRHGQNLQDRYKVRPETYLSITTDGFPNYFQSLGPNAGRGNGNLLVTIEAVHHYVGQILQKLATGNVKWVEVKRQPVQNFSDYCDVYFKRTVFSAECGSWYKTIPEGAPAEQKNNGRISGLWPGSNIHQLKALETVRWEDYDMETMDGNDFGWFGDGWSVAERDGDAEGMSWYLNGSNMVHEDLVGEEQVKVSGVRGLGVNGVNLNGNAKVNGELKKEELDKLPNGVHTA